VGLFRFRILQGSTHLDYEIGDFGQFLLENDNNYNCLDGIEEREGKCEEGK
jgi:hypothetical protein